ncbi:MAG: zinc metallopeptidase [Myxococcales bacterium]|nr:zinc metallopeptidase [Myxococcales bacterium]
MIGFDPVYFMFALPGLLLALYASWRTRSTFREYAEVAPSTHVTGAEAAARMLAAEGLRGVHIEPTRGFLSDHYDPGDRTLRLSEDVYYGRSLAAVGVACHEAGHALQHAEGYRPLMWRSALVPVTQLGSSLSWIVLTAGFVLHAAALVYLGIALFSAAVVFALVTLPVEWNASARAKALMVRAGIVRPQERPHAGAVLDAAFLTYLAAAVSSILTLLYYLLRAGAFSRSED